jgi:hypothetical protein
MKNGMFEDSDIIDVVASDDSVEVVSDELCDFDFEDDITRLGDEVLTSLGKIHIPTKELRKKVRVLSGYGLNQERIAFIIGCTVHDIRKHYGRDCRDGRAYAFARIAQTGYKKALGGDTALIKYYLSSFSKADEFNDTKRIEHTGADGGELSVVHKIERLVIEHDSKD